MKSFFIDYLIKLDLYSLEVETAFDLYFNQLQNANKIINLFSRKMVADEIWSKHFIDSVSIFEVYRDFQHKNILDFGTGGGLPGVPIKILANESNMFLLDSTKKKMDILKKMVSELCVQKVSFLLDRIESNDLSIYKDFFDIIVCRSVKITEVLQKAISRIIKKPGKLFLYKAKDLSDINFFDKVSIHTLDIKVLGERKIIEINYG